MFPRQFLLLYCQPYANTFGKNKYVYRQVGVELEI